MATIIKNKEELGILRESGRRLAVVLGKLSESVVAGITTKQLDDIARDLIEGAGDDAAFLGYKPEGASFPFPAALCVSVNNEVVHGIPGDRILKNGDIVVLDLGVKYKGMITDSAITVAVGEVDDIAKRLMSATKEALGAGIAAAKVNGRVGDISNAIEKIAKKAGFAIADDLGGHSVGRKVHEEPFIANFGKKGSGAVLKEGMVLALEPIFNEGDSRIVFDEDGYTIKTKDGKRSAQFEHTIVIRSSGTEIVTKV